MSSIYDSRAFVKRLTEAGMPEQQADTLASENLLLIAEHLATKEDLRALETGLQNSITQLRTEMNAQFELIEIKFESIDAKFQSIDTKFFAMDAKMGALESRIVAKLGILMGAMVATIAALIKLL
jgi:hypothetical protein